MGKLVAGSAGLNCNNPLFNVFNVAVGKSVSPSHPPLLTSS